MLPRSDLDVDLDLVLDLILERARPIRDVEVRKVPSTSGRQRVPCARRPRTAPKM